MCLGEVGLVRSIGSDGSLIVDIAGRSHSVATLALDGPVIVGEWVLVHSGFALALVPEREARQAVAMRNAESR